MPHDWFVPLTNFFFACQMFVHHISVMNSSPQLGASLLSFGPGKADGISQFHGTDYDHQCTRPSDIRFSNSCLHMRFNYFFLTVSFHFHFTCQRLPANYESAMRSFIIDSFRWPVSKTSQSSSYFRMSTVRVFLFGFWLRVDHNHRSDLLHLHRDLGFLMAGHAHSVKPGSEKRLECWNIQYIQHAIVVFLQDVSISLHIL